MKTPRDFSKPFRRPGADHPRHLDKQRARCADCGRVFRVEDLEPIEEESIFEVVGFGEEMPVGRCPATVRGAHVGEVVQCNAVCHLELTRYTLGTVHRPLTRADVLLINEALQCIDPETRAGKLRAERLEAITDALLHRGRPRW